jgi:hypothetical protein
MAECSVSQVITLLALEGRPASKGNKDKTVFKRRITGLTQDGT